MVLEALVNPINAERKPWETYLMGLVYASVAIIVSLTLFQDFSSIVMVSLTAMASVPLIYGAIKMEEKKDIEILEEKLLIKEHGKALLSFVLLFLGFVTAFSIWYTALPEATTNTLFQIQINTISEINSPTTGQFIGLSSTIGKIFLNNIKVLLFCLLFAFFYGFGAIFILTWNASVLATVIGAFLKANANNIILAPLILLRYTLHGIPEIAAYFMAGLAGGIISIALIRHDFGSEKFKHILTDSLDLIVLAVVTLLGAALVEVFISPMIL